MKFHNNTERQEVFDKFLDEFLLDFLLHFDNGKIYLQKKNGVFFLVFFFFIMGFFFLVKNVFIMGFH